MTPKNYDFCGWVTKNNLRCADGRVILEDAFAHQDGAKVPLVWNHNHGSPEEVLGFTILENRPEGVYGYSYCNDTDNGQRAKMLVQHRDIDSYSIFANHLKQNGNAVHSGNIKEVSLVMAPANPGAHIENVALAHGDGISEDEAEIFTGELLELYHSDIDDDITDDIENDEDVDMTDEKMKSVIESLTDDQKDAISYMLGKASAGELQHADDAGNGKTVADVLKTLNEEQKNAVAYIIGVAIENAKNGEAAPEMAHSDDDYYYEDEGDYDEMKRNVFDGANDTGSACLTHSDLNDILMTAKKSGNGTLRDVYMAKLDELGLSHDDGDSGIEYSEGDQDYFVNDPSFLFPEAKALDNPPAWIKRDTDWVSVVMNGTKHTPFSRIKSVFADITEDEARAKGYIKGKRKLEEVFTLLKRVTTPQTIYKKQKLDRDDELDITDFSVIPWLWAEMRIMLDEEIARAVLVGDGRLTSSDEHIKEDCIRPIWKDDDLFTIKAIVPDGTDPEIAEATIDEAVRSRKNYKGSGNPIMFTTENYLTEMLLLKDELKHRLYKTNEELATAMRVSKIVTVPVMENLTRDGKKLVAIIVNLADYTIGADRGGEINKFEDFDIDFNAKKLLIETRCSGALIKPYSAIVIEAGTVNPSQG